MHSFDGSTVRTVTSLVAAAYGTLRVFESSVSICVSSGDSPRHAITTEGLAGNVDSQLRLGVEDESDLSSFALADEIMQWDTISGVLRRSKIPQDLEPSCIVKNSLYFAESLETLEH